APDAPTDAPPDAAPSTFLLEAETPTTITPAPDGMSTWAPSTGVTGFFGTGYMQCGPDAIPACIPDTMIPTCSAVMAFALDDITPGSYYIHVRQYAANTAEDSVWYGLDGVPQPVPVSTNGVFDAWVWSTHGPFTLAGSHVLDFWVR